MKYIDYFELMKEERDIKPFKCKFIDGLNIIVGENGSGKSAMLWLMSNPDIIKKGKNAKVKLVNSKKRTTFKFLDTEKQNPRMTDPNSMPRDLYGYGITSRFTSHGQTIFPLVKAVGEMKDQITFIDEPEAGVSLSNQVKLVRAFKKAVKNKCQVIIATHSYVIINSVKTVFDLDKRQWTMSDDYLKSLNL